MNRIYSIDAESWIRTQNVRGTIKPFTAPEQWQKNSGVEDDSED